MRVLTYVEAALLLLATIGAGEGMPLPQTLDVGVEPPAAAIGMVYGGVDIAVTCEVKPGTEIAMLITGPPSDLHLRKKKRLWGVFWAPAENVTFEGIPSLYLLQSSVELADLAPAGVLTELELGYGALIREPDSDDPELFQELIRLKESEDVFSSSSEGIRFAAGPPGRKRAEAVFHLPSSAPPASYAVQVLAFRDHQLVGRGEALFELRLQRFTSFLTTLARDHGLLYGILAVVIALAAGLAVGFIYGSTGKH